MGEWYQLGAEVSLTLLLGLYALLLRQSVIKLLYVFNDLFKLRVRAAQTLTDKSVILE